MIAAHRICAGAWRCPCFQATRDSWRCDGSISSFLFRAPCWPGAYIERDRNVQIKDIACVLSWKGVPKVFAHSVEPFAIGLDAPAKPVEGMYSRARCGGWRHGSLRRVLLSVSRRHGSTDCLSLQFSCSLSRTCSLNINIQMFSPVNASIHSYKWLWL